MRRALAGSPFACAVSTLGKALLCGGHPVGLGRDFLRVLLQHVRHRHEIVSDNLHSFRALAEARLLGHRVGK